MTNKTKELLQFLFPEYQIKACVDERGFIAKGEKKKNYVNSTSQIYSQGNTQQQSAPITQPVQKVSQTKQQLNKTQIKSYVPSKEDTKTVNRANDVFDKDSFMDLNKEE